MAGTLTIQISGDAQKLINELKKAGVSVKEFAGETEKGGKGAKSFGGELTGLAGKLGIGLAIGGAVTGLIGFGKESFAASASAERLGRATDALGKAFGASGDEIVDSIQRASGFTIDRLTAMQAANKAMLFGIVSSKKDFTELTQIAVTLGAAMGQDAAKSLDDLTTALGRQSPLILDNLGITLKLEDAYRIYAESLGKTAEQLTEGEKKQAFLNAALIEGRKKVEELGGVSGGAATSTEALSAAVADLKVAYGDELAPRLAVIIDTITSLIRWTSENIDTIQRWSGVLSPLYGLYVLFIDEVTETGTVVEQATQAISTQVEANQELTESVTQSTEAYQQQQATLANYYNSVTKMDEESKEKRLQNNLELSQAQNDTNAEIAGNNRELVDKLNAIEAERAEKKRELDHKAATEGASMTDQRYSAEMGRINSHYDQLIGATRSSYESQNKEIASKLEQKRAMMEAEQERERKEYEEHLNDLKLKTGLAILEQTGQLEELTGIAGIKATDAADLVKAGLIDISGELGSALSGTISDFTKNQAEATKVARENQADLKKIYEGTFQAVGQSHDSMTGKIKQNSSQIDLSSQKAVDALLDVVDASLKAQQAQKKANTGGPGFASGGSFIVPPGYPNDSFPVRVSSGEGVEITPANQVTNNYYNLSVNSMRSSESVGQDFNLMRAWA